MKVFSTLINQHLDWDCAALIKNTEQSPISLSAAKASEKLSHVPKCSYIQKHYDALEVEDFQAKSQGRSSFEDEEAKFSSPIHGSTMGLHSAPLAKKAEIELGIESDVCKLEAIMEECGEISNSMTASNSHFTFSSDGGLQHGPSICERCPFNKHENDIDANNKHSGIRQRDPMTSAESMPTQAIVVSKISSERCRSSSEASASNSKIAKSNQLILGKLSPPKAPKGHYVFENFISEQEEKDVLLFLDADLKNPWKLSTFNGLHEGKAYGLSTDLRERCVRPAIFEMPKVLAPIIERMRTNLLVLKDFWPNETNAISYHKHKGHWLKPHVDDRQLSGTIVVNLSLCGDCRMTYIRERGPKESYKVVLRRRCIQVLTGESRYSFTHSIHNDDLLNPRRVSMTLRQSVNA